MPKARAKIKYLGSAELAKLCRVTPQAVSNWVKRESCPEPLVRLQMGPVWRVNPDLRRFIIEKRKERDARIKARRRSGGRQHAA